MLKKLSVWSCLELRIQDKSQNKIHNKSFGGVAKFWYLGTILTNQNYIKKLKAD
jgi:hypothetical protein